MLTRRTIVAVAATVCFVSVFAPVGRANPPGGTEAMPSGPISAPTPRTSVLVHASEDHALHETIVVARSLGMAIGTRYKPIGVFVAYGSEPDVATLAKSDTVAGLEPNSTLELLTDTSHIATRGDVFRSGSITLPNGRPIDGHGVGVAVVDSGIDGTHPDLVGRIGGNVKIVCTTPQLVATGATGFTECLGPKTAVPVVDTDTPSAGGHGTHVAGIIAGGGESSDGTFSGAAPGATLYGVSIGTAVSAENGLDGLAWVLENHDQVDPPIRVVNNSWGSDHADYDPDDAFFPALWKMQEALVAEGVSVVFAAGNGGGDGGVARTSAQCINPTPGIVCVANYDDGNSGTRQGSISTTSSRGSKADPKSWPDISAPGTAIVSTCRLTLPICWLGEGQVDPPANLYASISGTSMAAPHVAGIIAQVYQVRPGLNPAEVEDLLEDTAHKFRWGDRYGLLKDPFNRDDPSSFEKGHGLIDASAAIRWLLGKE